MKEFRELQCHPDNVNATIEEATSWGWELVSNQRCQEEGVRFGNEVIRTFNKLTFSREKSAPWYSEVCRLEQEYLELSKYNEHCCDVRYSKIILILGFVWYIVPGLIYWIIIRRKKNKKMAENSAQMAKNRERMQWIRSRVRELLIQQDA